MVFGLDNLEQLQQLDRLAHLRQLDALRPQLSTSLQPLSRLQRLDTLTHLNQLDHLQGLSSSLGRLRHLDTLQRLNRLETLGKLERLDNLQQLGVLSRLPAPMQHLQALDNLDSMKHLQRIDAQLAPLRQLDRLDALQQLQHLEKLAVIDRVLHFEPLFFLYLLNLLLPGVIFRGAWGVFSTRPLSWAASVLMVVGDNVLTFLAASVLTYDVIGPAFDAHRAMYYSLWLGTLVLFPLACSWLGALLCQHPAFGQVERRLLNLRQRIQSAAAVR